jgi:hypothetical protein
MVAMTHVENANLFVFELEFIDLCH